VVEDVHTPDFDEPRLAHAVEELPPEAVHALPFGAIRLDGNGKAVFYSDSERRLSGFRKEVVGHDFFVEIAPCMNNPNFRGRIDRALETGKLDLAFSFVTDLPITVKDVDVRIQSASGGGCWIFLRHGE
jgi:photoactive yellow protein